jgi:hypothetical protein
MLVVFIIILTCTSKSSNWCVFVRSSHCTFLISPCSYKPHVSNSYFSSLKYFLYHKLWNFSSLSSCFFLCYTSHILLGTLRNACLGLAYFSAHDEVLSWHSFSCLQAAPYELSLDVNKMFRRSVRPRGVLPALGLLPGEDRGSSGRIMTLTGPSSSVRSHMLRQQHWSKSANQQLAFLVPSTFAILNPLYINTSNFVQIFLCSAYLVYCFMVSEIGNRVPVYLDLLRVIEW